MSSLDERSQKVLDVIVEKNATELSEYDQGFLRARVSYLNGDQLKKFDKVLNAKEVKVSKTEDEPKSNEVKKSDEKLSYKELQAEATKLGISPVVGVSGDELKALIAEAK